MLMRRKFLIIIASAIMAFTSLIVAGGSAHASDPNICGNGGTGYCLNAWNGGNFVKMYYGGYSNDNFEVYQLTNMCNHGKVDEHTSCPFTAGSGLNTEFQGDAIVAIQYLNATDSCVGSTVGTDATLTLCPDLSGNGGGNGTIMAISPISPVCFGDFAYGQYVDRYWSDNVKQAAYLDSGGNPGAQAYYGTGDGTCWNQTG